MIIKLENEKISIEVNSLGAELTNLKKVKNSIELLWQGDEEHWGGQSPLLFPIIGGIPDNQYILDGKVYKMASHGFAKHCEFQLVEKGKDAIVFRLNDSDITFEQYPFHFELNVSYTLKENCLTTGFSLTNNNDKTMLFSLGAHPGFNCPLHENEKMVDYYLVFEKMETASRRFKACGLLTGETEKILKNQKDIRLSHNLFYKDAIILDHLASNWVELRSDKSKQIIRMEFEGFPYFGIWSAPNDAPFVCLEPWYGVDSIHGDSYDLRQKEGIMPLNPGEVFKCEYRIIV